MIRGYEKMCISTGEAGMRRNTYFHIVFIRYLGVWGKLNLGKISSYASHHPDSTNHTHSKCHIIRSSTVSPA